MSNVWGPVIWNLFHTLVEKVNSKYFKKVSQELFSFIKRICSLLPCPECQEHAKTYLKSVKLTLNKKEELKAFLFMFHNVVNAHKKKKEEDTEILEKYKEQPLSGAFNDFVRVYSAKGNVRMLADTLHRQRLIVDFRTWLLTNKEYFTD